MTDLTPSHYDFSTKFQLPSFLSISPQQLAAGKHINTVMGICWRAASLFSIYDHVLSLKKIKNFLAGPHSGIINLLTNKSKFLCYLKCYLKYDLISKFMFIWSYIPDFIRTKNKTKKHVDLWYGYHNYYSLTIWKRKNQGRWINATGNFNIWVEMKWNWGL